MGSTRTYATPKLTVNLGPLTSTYTPPPDCTQLTLAVMGNIAVSKPPKEYFEFLYGYNCTNDFEQTRPMVEESCYPPQYARAYNLMTSQAPDPNPIFPVYSPASICPHGYATKCTMVHSKDKKSISDATAWGNLAHGDVAFGCCPDGFECDAQPYTCISRIKDKVITADMDNSCNNVYTNTRSRVTNTVTVDETVLASVYAPQVVLVSPKQTSTAPPAQSSQSTSGYSSHGLSQGAKIGIGVAIPLAFMALIIAGALCYRRRLKKKTLRADAMHEPIGKPELDANGLSKSTILSLEKWKSELDGTPSHSRNVSGTSAELDGGTLRYSELYGDSRTTLQTSELPGNSPLRNSDTAVFPMAEPSSQFKIPRRPVSSVSALSNSSTGGAQKTAALASLDEYGSEPEMDAISHDMRRRDD